MATIVFYGKTYNSVDEMPADVRQAYEQTMSTCGAMGAGLLADANNNGIPDMLENLGATTMSVSSASSMILFEGKTYSHVNDLPPDAKAKYEAAMAIRVLTVTTSAARSQHMQKVTKAATKEWARLFLFTTLAQATSADVLRDALWLRATGDEAEALVKVA